MGHELLFASITVNFEISNLSLCRNYFLCGRSHKDDAQGEAAGRGDGCVCQRILMCAFENESWSTSLLLEHWCELQGCGVVGRMQVWRPGILEYISVWFNFNMLYNAPRKDNYCCSSSLTTRTKKQFLLYMNVTKGRGLNMKKAVAGPFRHCLLMPSVVLCQNQIYAWLLWQNSLVWLFFLSLLQSSSMWCSSAAFCHIK